MKSKRVGLTIGLGSILLVMIVIAFNFRETMSGNVVFRLAMNEAEGDVKEALTNLGPAFCDPDGNLVRLSLTRTVRNPATRRRSMEYQLDNRVLHYLQPFDTIRFLGIGRTRINDDGMKYIAAMTGLKTLDMKQTRISRDGLLKLKSNKSLRLIYVDGTDLTRADADELETALPDCHVLLWPQDSGSRSPLAAMEEQRDFIEDVKQGRLKSVGKFH